MKLKLQALPKFLKLSFLSGAYASLSFSAFAMVAYFTAPEIERLTKFLKSSSLGSWFAYNFLDLNALWLSLFFILMVLLASFIGFVSGIVAKITYEEAESAFKGCLISEPTSKPQIADPNNPAPALADATAAATPSVMLRVESEESRCAISPTEQVARRKDG